MNDEPIAPAAGAPGPDIIPQNVSLINVPIFYTSMMNIFLAGNDATLIFMRPHPAISAEMKEGTALALSEPVAAMQMSMQTLKDLYLAIKLQIEPYEKDFGEIQTTYSRGLGKPK